MHTRLNPKKNNEIMPATAIQLAEINRSQIHQKELKASYRRPYILFFSILLPTLASHNRYLFGPDGIFLDPFLSLQTNKENEFTTTGNNYVSKVVDECNKDLESALTHGRQLPSVTQIDDIQIHPLLKYRSYGQYMDSMDSNEVENYLTPIATAKNNFHLTADHLKKYYALIYIDIARHLDQANVPKKYLSLNTEELIFEISDLKKHEYTVYINVLVQESFSKLAELIIAAYNQLKKDMEIASFFNQARKDEIIRHAKIKAMDFPHYRFMLALASSSLLFTKLIELFFRIRTVSDPLPKDLSEKQANDLILQLKNKNELLTKTHKYILLILCSNIKFAGFFLKISEKNSPAFIYALLLTSSTSLMSDFYRLYKENNEKQNLQKNMKHICFQLNKAVNSTEEHWQIKLGSTQASSFLIFSPKKEHYGLSKRCLNQVVKNILLKNGINVISCEKNSLTVDPIKLSDIDAVRINNEINLHLKRLQDIKILTAQLKQLFNIPFYVETLSNGFPTARFSLPLPNDLKLEQLQTIFPQCTLELNGPMLTLTGHTPAAADFAKHFKTKQRPQFFQPSCRKKAKIYGEAFKLVDTRLETKTETMHSEITLPEDLKKEGKILELNGALLFIRNPSSHSHVTQNEMDDLTGTDGQFRIARNRGQSGYKLRTDGVLCYKKQNSRKRLFFLEAKPVKIWVDGNLQEVPSCSPDRIIKKR